MTAFHIEKLTRRHAVDDFDCGREPLNRFLVRFALPNQQANASQTYVGLADETVIGFYTLVVGEVEYADAPERLTKGLGRYPVPVMLLARLAVATAWQGKGIGTGLLKDALRRTVNAADIAGIRAVVVHAKDEQAQDFYAHFGFAAGLPGPLHLYVLTRELRAMRLE